LETISIHNSLFSGSIQSENTDSKKLFPQQSTPIVLLDFSSSKPYTRGTEAPAKF